MKRKQIWIGAAILMLILIGIGFIIPRLGGSLDVDRFPPEKAYIRHVALMLYSYTSDADGIYPASLDVLSAETSDPKILRFIKDSNLSYNTPEANLNDTPTDHILLRYTFEDGSSYVCNGGFAISYEKSEQGR